MAVSQTLYLDTLKTHSVAPVASVGFTNGIVIYSYGGVYTLNSSVDISISGVNAAVAKEGRSTTGNGFAISLSGAIANELRGDIVGVQLGLLYETVKEDITRSSAFGAGLLFSKRTGGFLKNKLVVQAGVAAVPVTRIVFEETTTNGKAFFVISGGFGLALGKSESTGLIIEPGLGYTTVVERFTGTVAVIVKL